MVKGQIHIIPTSNQWRTANSHGWHSFILAIHSKIKFGALAQSLVVSGSWRPLAAWMSIGIIFISSPYYSLMNHWLFDLIIYSNIGKLHGFIGVHDVNPQLTVNPSGRISIDDKIERFFLHPQWNEATLNADIALIRFRVSIPFSCKNYFFVLKKIVAY